jgi:hypothetical protein
MALPATDMYDATLGAFHELGRLLEALTRLSTRQTEDLPPDEYLSILEHKQRLLDAVSAREPQALFNQAEREEWSLRRAGHREQADTLRTAAQENLGRLTRLQQHEAAAREAWQARRDRLRETLTAFSQHSTARRRYTEAPMAAPRFLNASL